ncbi:hypothetical protein APA_4314 [Pseudanabaena sp. lw0831]|nr:hypothetical protein APA_4314 [Pseudanabaena sp. lw0831]
MKEQLDIENPLPLMQKLSVQTAPLVIFLLKLSRSGILWER